MKAAEDFFSFCYTHTSFTLLRLYVKLLLQLRSLSWLNWSLRNSPPFLEQMRVHQAVMKMGYSYMHQKFCHWDLYDTSFMMPFKRQMEIEHNVIGNFCLSIFKTTNITIMAKKQSISLISITLIFLKERKFNLFGIAV